MWTEDFSIKYFSKPRDIPTSGRLGVGEIVGIGRFLQQGLRAALQLLGFFGPVTSSTVSSPRMAFGSLVKFHASVVKTDSISMSSLLVIKSFAVNLISDSAVIHRRRL